MSRLKLKWISPTGETRIHEVGSEGLSLGRSSSNTLHFDDESLSRRHCLFNQVGEAGIKVTDLASANGTFVNGEQLDFASRELKAGDRVEAGEQSFEVLGDAPKAVPPPATGVDLGLGDRGGSEAGGAGSEPQKGSKRLLLWGAVFALLVLLAAVAFFAPVDDAVAPTVPIADDAAPKSVITSVAYEKIEANGQEIFRYAMEFDRYTRRLAVRFDDVPVNHRGLDKSCELKPDQIARIDEIFGRDDFDSLDESYTGSDPADPNVLRSLCIRIVRGGRVKEVSVVNSSEPELFAHVRDALEAFSRNELGVWAVHFSREKLLELASESVKRGDQKFEERDVDYGNLAAAVAAYAEAVYYLETVEPKPDGYDTLVDKLATARKDLNVRYEEIRFRADKAINLQDWQEARKELMVLCETVSDKNDERNREAMAKLVDVEKRLKKEERK